MVDFVDIKSLPHRPIFLLRLRCGTYTSARTYTWDIFILVLSEQFFLRILFICLFIGCFFLFSVDLHRWNDDDDDDANDRKTDLAKQSSTSEENDRKRKSRWNGRKDCSYS